MYTFIVLPKSLKELTFGTGFTNGYKSLTADILSESLKKLTISTNYTNEDESFPPNIEVVYRK